MSNPVVTLSAVRRSEAGRAGAGDPRAARPFASARGLRRAGYLPAVLYGRGLSNVLLAVEARVFRKIAPSISSSTLLTLSVSGDEPRRVLLQEVQRDPLSGEPTHLDFHQVSLTEKIRAKVPLEATGVSAAVKDRGGVLVQSVSEVEVEGLPGDLPRALALDIARLVAFEDRLTVADLVLPPNVTCLTRSGEILAVVQPPRTEEELKAELETPAAAPAEVRTEAEVKKAAAEAKEAAAAPADGEKPAPTQGSHGS